MSEQTEQRPRGPTTSHAVEAKWQRVWEELQPFRADDDSAAREALRADDVPLPQR